MSDADGPDRSLRHNDEMDRDPADLLIVANAMANGNAPLVTKDERIRGAYANTIW